MTGTVLDTTSGKFLEGAEVSVEGTEVRTSSARGGRFTLIGVPSGSQKVVVNYPGLDASTQTVSVPRGQTVDLPVRLTSETIVMDSLKYTPHFNRRLVLRAGFSQTVGIPDYSELLPLATTSTVPGGNDATISIPSPNLKPYKTNNYDSRSITTSGNPESWVSLFSART